MKVSAGPLEKRRSQIALDNRNFVKLPIQVVRSTAEIRIRFPGTVDPVEDFAKEKPVARNGSERNKDVIDKTV